MIAFEKHLAAGVLDYEVAPELYASADFLQAFLRRDEGLQEPNDSALSLWSEAVGPWEVCCVVVDAGPTLHEVTVVLVLRH